MLDADTTAAHTVCMTERRRFTATEAEAMTPEERRAATAAMDSDDPVVVRMLERGRDRLAERFKQFTS